MLPGITLDLVLNHVSDMVFIMSADASSNETALTFRYVKMSSTAMMGSGLNEDAYGATFHDVVESHEADILWSNYQKAARLRRPVTFVLNHNGQIGETVLNPILTPDGRCTHVMGTVRDVTERLAREAALKQLALQDPLTGLINRHGLKDAIQTAVREARRTATYVSFLLVDVDNLKQINDTHGHVVGDLYLQGVAQRINSALRADDTVARVGGDEFLVVANIAGETDATWLAERILAAVNSPWPHADLRITMSISIGIASYPIHGLTAWEVVKAADKAMYEAKHQGGLRYKFARFS